MTSAGESEPVKPLNPYAAPMSSDAVTANPDESSASTRFPVAVLTFIIVGSISTMVAWTISGPLLAFIDALINHDSLALRTMLSAMGIIISCAAGLSLGIQAARQTMNSNLSENATESLKAQESFSHSPTETQSTPLDLP